MKNVKMQKSRRYLNTRHLIRLIQRRHFTEREVERSKGKKKQLVCLKRGNQARSRCLEAEDELEEQLGSPLNLESADGSITTRISDRSGAE